ncbi:MAG: sigma-70 family RNA polymerase sigma factor [Polyangiaceae bacterium]
MAPNATAFPPTRASLVAQLDDRDPVARARALDALVRHYGAPVHAYLRARFPSNAEEARDLTQAFFAKAIEDGTLRSFDPARGRFRSFIKLCAERFALNERKAARRLRRGGAVVHVDVDAVERTLEAMGPGLDPDEAFHRVWLETFLRGGLEELEADCRARGREIQFEVFQFLVMAPAPEPDGAPKARSYADAAAHLHTSVSKVTNYLFTMKRMLREILTRRLREACSSEEEFTDLAPLVLGPPPWGSP